MVETLEFLANKEYIGRMIFIGRHTDSTNFILYAITGRSHSSRARKLVKTLEGSIKTEVTDPEQLKKGNPDLLIYNAIRRLNNMFIVSNGGQTDLIFDTAKALIAKDKCYSPIQILAESFKQPYLTKGNKESELIDLTSYEPDDPNFTPRISGVVWGNRTAVSIVKNNDGSPERSYFEFPMKEGLGRMIFTYTGQNVPKGSKIPVFEGEPIEVIISNLDLRNEDLADYVYDLLGPKQPGEGIINPCEDFRVGVAYVGFNSKTNKLETKVIDKRKK